MSLFVNASFKPSPNTPDYCKCFTSIRGGIDITITGNSGTFSLYKKVNGVSVPVYDSAGAAITDIPITCNPSLRICEVIGSDVEFCIVIKGVVGGDCIQILGVDVNASIVKGVDGGGGGGGGEACPLQIFREPVCYEGYTPDDLTITRNSLKIEAPGDDITDGTVLTSFEYDSVIYDLKVNLADFTNLENAVVLKTPGYEINKPVFF